MVAQSHGERRPAPERSPASLRCTFAAERFPTTPRSSWSSSRAAHICPQDRTWNVQFVLKMLTIDGFDLRFRTGMSDLWTGPTRHRGGARTCQGGWRALRTRVMFNRAVRETETQPRWRDAVDVRYPT